MARKASTIFKCTLKRVLFLASIVLPQKMDDDNYFEIDFSFINVIWNVFNTKKCIYYLFSAVTLQFVSHSFLDYHDPTIGRNVILSNLFLVFILIPKKCCCCFVIYLIEDSYQQQAVIDGEAALLDILDTAGQVEFTAMRDQYMRCGEGFIICYSVTDRHSFQEASEYRKLITRVRLSEDIPLVLIANKLDLQSQRKVCYLTQPHFYSRT